MIKHRDFKKWLLIMIFQKSVEQCEIKNNGEH